MYLPRYVYNLLLLFDESKMEKNPTFISILYLIVVRWTKEGKNNTCGGKKNKSTGLGVGCRSWSLSCH